MSVNFFGTPPPNIDPKSLSGKLIIIEGQDSSGRTTQVSMLANWLEQKGYPVTQTGLKRSILVAESLEQARQGNILSPRTLSLFYATDFYDQLENRIIPMLKAGHIVLADRYIYTLIARDVVRGAKLEWNEKLYSKAVIPTAVFFLKTSLKSLVDRALEANGELNYWESGMDMGISRDWFESFSKYQMKMNYQFNQLGKKYGFEFLNANKSIKTIHLDLKSRVEKILEQKYGKEVQ
jgi:dTMP kinase